MSVMGGVGVDDSEEESGEDDFTKIGEGVLAKCMAGCEFVLISECPFCCFEVSPLSLLYLDK